MQPATLSRAIGRLWELGVEVTGNRALTRDTAALVAFIRRSADE